MQSWFSVVAAVPRSIRRRLGRVLALVVVCAFFLIAVSEARAENVNYWSTPWVTASGGATCRNYTENCSAQAACESFRVANQASKELTQIVLLNARTGSCYLRDKGQTGVGSAWSSITSNVDYVSTPQPQDCTAASVKNKYVGAWVVGSATSAPGTACIQGCAYPQGSIAVAGSFGYGMSIGAGTGATCSGANYTSIDTTTKKDDPPSLVSCAQKGQIYGTVNGVGQCAKPGDVPGSSVKQTGTSTTTNTDASGVQAAPQSTGTTTTITNNNGVTNVTQTKTNPDGTKTETTEPIDMFCAKNPNDSACKANSSAEGGADCVAPPVCKGDAVQCAMLNQQWHTRCDLQQPNDASALGQQLVAGNDPAGNPASPSQRTVTPIATALDQSPFLGGGGLSDKVVTVSGQSITLPFSKLNQYLEWLGRIFVVISLIGALRIVLGGFK